MKLAAPQTITYGQPKAGQTLAVTCAAAAAPEGGSIKAYVWERRIDAGVYSQAGITAVNLFNYTVPQSGATLTLRVKAVDSSGNESGYCYGEAREIIYNRPPSVSGTDEDRGVLTAPFSYAYTVTDPDGGDVLTVSERLDGVELSSFAAEPGKAYTAVISDAQWLSLGNGSHTLEICASDALGESSIRTVTFSRQTSRIAMSRRTATESRPAKVFISLFPKVDPEKADVHLEVCNNPFDASPAWEDISEKVNSQIHSFANTQVETTHGIGYRFSITPKEGETALFISAAVRYR